MAGARGFTRGFESSGGRGTRPKFRSDLTLIIENAQGSSDGTVRVVDPVTGKYFAFNDREYYLCELADGVNTTTEIQAKYKTKFGTDIEMREVVSFYRRLRVLNLLEKEEPDPAANASGFAGATSGGPGASPGAGGGGRGFGGGFAGAGAAAGGASPGAGPRAFRQGGGARQSKSKGHGARTPAVGIPLFNPTRMLHVFGIIFYPLKRFWWMLFPAIMVAVFLMFHEWGRFWGDLRTATTDTGILETLVIGRIVDSFVANVARGTVVRAFGGKVTVFGVKLTLGFLPRFYTDYVGLESLDKRGKLWAYAAPLLARLANFAIGVIIWGLFRFTGSPTTGDPILTGCLVIAQMALVTFVLMSCPLMTSSMGYRWLTTYFDIPNLRERSFAALNAKLRGRKLPPGLEKDLPGLIAFGLGTIFSTLFIMFGILLYVGIVLELNFGGSGTFMFFVLGLAAFLWGYITWQKRRGERVEASGGQLALAGDPTFASIDNLAYLNPHTAPEAEVEEVGPRLVTEPATEEFPHKTAQLVWALSVVALVIIAFLPYPFETGGDTTILPIGASSASAQVEGEVIDIYPQDNDWVQKGQILAQLSNWDEQHAVDVTRAELDKAEANLAVLLDGASDEQIEVAQQKVDDSRSHVVFAEQQAKRYAELYKTGTASQKDYEQTQSDYNNALSDLSVAIANLELVKSQASADEIAASKADVERLTHELKYDEDQLARTQLRAPSSGRIVTPNLYMLIGKHLDEGDALLQIQDMSVVYAQIMVPETDIRYVKMGGKIRLKLWGYSNQIVTGTVCDIGTATQAANDNQYVLVKAKIPNPDGRIKGGMTGFAKVAGQTMPVWQAYLQLFMRFFQVEIWSWIP